MPFTKGKCFALGMAALIFNRIHLVGQFHAAKVLMEHLSLTKYCC